MFSNLSRIFKKNSDAAFFFAVFIYVLFVFQRAFTINFFQDDYFFLKISKVNNVIDILNFYSPLHEYSYKPLATETFYYILQVFNSNIFLGHLIVFITYFVGLIFLYRVTQLLSGNILLGRLVVFLYAISFIHVFQLYWFATFQEVAVFTFLTISFYSFLKSKYRYFFLFFFLALLCKETAALYMPFVLLFVLIRSRGKGELIKNQVVPLLNLVILTFVFWLLYRYSLTYVTSLDNYKIEWHPRLLLNNGIWHLLWGMGFPNFMPDYFSSFFSRPIPAFWETVKAPYTKIYLELLVIYLFLFINLTVLAISRSKNGRKLSLILMYCIVNFFIFLGPILFFPHKWMIRLTFPLVFISLLQAYILQRSLTDKSKYIKYLGILVLILYIGWNFFGVSVHERTSTYLLENSIHNKANDYFTKHKKEILMHDLIYFKDTSHNLPKGWNGSEKLKNSLSGIHFLDHFFPEKKMKVIYGFENEKIPENVYVIESNLFL